MGKDAAFATKLGKDDRRDAMVAIAHEVFLANGYAGTSMSAIAARVGGSKATLYNYFKSKQDLFIAVVESLCGQFDSLLDAAEIEGSGDLRTSLSRFGGDLLEIVLSERVIGTYRLVTAEAARFPEVGSAMYNSGLRQATERLAGFLEKAKSKGQLRSDAEIEVAAQQFLYLCLSGLLHRRLWMVTDRPSKEDAAANVASAIAAFMGAYGVG
jgi:AcrR family transcriptional regulator